MQKKKNSSKRAPTSVHIDPSILKAFKVACVERGVSYSAAFDEALAAWTTGFKTVPRPIKADADRNAVPYPEPTRKWHDILEMVLSDPNERIGIEKNLEWAGAAVKLSATVTKRKRSGA